MQSKKVLTMLMGIRDCLCEDPTLAMCAMLSQQGKSQGTYNEGGAGLR